jgi:predicted Fe-S protein YdhL (DUF1289 family)
VAADRRRAREPAVSGLPPPASRGAGPPLSPCVQVCAMDAQGRFCTGCMRTLDEIARWWQMPDREKRAVLAALPDRRALGDDAREPRP